MTTTSPPTNGHDEIDSSLGERYYRDRQDVEERYTDEIIALIRRAIDVNFKRRQPARRDAHAFDNGCVRALFRVDPDLNADLRHGVFIPGQEYKAWIRFSNGNSEPRSRWWPDARGMAIKLMGIPGAKLLQHETYTQDFILISHPVFFVDDLDRYKALLETFLKGGIFDQYVRSFLKLRGREIWLALVANALWISNPLFHQYWSMTPYRLGTEPARKIAVKYTAKPRVHQRRTLFSRLAPYLRRQFSLKKEVNATLAGQEAQFDVYIQRYVDDRTTPIEDSKVEWSESVSKLEHVATISIPRQSIMSAEQDRFCENLSFNPWHGLPDHKPLGLINRVRRKVYVSISAYRRGLNQWPKIEPRGDETFGDTFPTTYQRVSTMRSYGFAASAIIVVSALLLALFSNGWWSCHGPLRFAGWVRDEASCAGRAADTFHAAGIKFQEGDEQRYFAAMDRGSDLTREESAGRNMWMVWTGGNDRFWDEIIKYSFGAFDLLKIVTSNPKGGFCTPATDSGYEGSSDKKYGPYSSPREDYWAKDEKACNDAGGTWTALTRNNRWTYYGLINEPCFEKAKVPVEYGLWLDQRSPGCPDDPFENAEKYPGVKIGARGDTIGVGSYYGKATGIVGLRLFPNPAFDQKAKDTWMKHMAPSGSADDYYDKPAFFKDKDLVRPYRVGMSCAFCHVGPSPINPPDDPDHPEWKNLSSTVGAQYLWLDRVFAWNPQDHKNFTYQLLHTARPGTFDTSLISSDNINNPRTMNAIYGLCPRLESALHWGSETLVGDALNNKRLWFDDFVEECPSARSSQRPDEHPHQVFTLRGLKDGSDSVGILGALNRVYFNIGLFSEEWLLHFHPFVGATPLKAITPITIAAAEKNSEYWKATEAQTVYMAKFLLKAGQPDYLKDAPNGDTYRDAYLKKTGGKVDSGKEVFAEHCARCHSSKLPTFPDGLDFNACNGANYLECWNKYWVWTETPAFVNAMKDKVKEADFLDNNFLSNDMRIPATLLKTNICSPLAMNAIKGNIWDSFSSQSYKDLPSVGSIDVLAIDDPFAHQSTDAVKKQSYAMPAGGRGYTRVPSLISLWSTAPLFLNNALGEFNSNPSVKARLDSFDSSIRQLLLLKPRENDRVLNDKNVGIIDRTTAQSYLKIPAGYLPHELSSLWERLHNFFPWIFNAGGDIEIGPIPKETPVDLLANLNLSGGAKGHVVDALLRAKTALQNLSKESSDEQAQQAFAPLVKDLLSLSTCPDFVVNGGHYFGTELGNEQKEDLIAFLMTL
jgi:hypothetical protein